MPAIGEVLLSITRDLQPGFVNESRRLKGLSSFLIGHPDDGEFAQFFIDQREQLLGGFRIARINGAEQLGDVGHALDGRPRPTEGERVRGEKWCATSRYHGFTLSHALAFGYVKHDEVITPDFVLNGKYTIDFAGKHYPAKALLEPPYDPKNEKIMV